MLRHVPSTLRRVMLDGPLKRCDCCLWTLPESRHVVVLAPRHHHGSRDDATRGMPLWGRAPCLQETPRGGCHAARHVHTARYPLYPGRPQETRTQLHTPPLYNKRSPHATSSILDAMLGLAAQHAHPGDATKHHRRVVFIAPATARVGSNSYCTTSSSLDAMASLAAGRTWTTTHGTHDPMTRMFLSYDEACSMKERRGM